MSLVERLSKARHAASSCAQLEEALRAHDYRAAWEHCRLLAGHTRRSVIPRAVTPEKALDPGAHEAYVKKVCGATSSLVPPQSSVSATQAWPSSLSDHFCRTPALRKQALKKKKKNGKATTTWSVPAELHKFHLANHIGSANPSACSGTAFFCRMLRGDEVPYQLADGEVFTITKPGCSGPDFMRFINLLDSTGKFLFGYWLSYALDPYRHWQFGFSDGRGVPDCLAIRYAVWERACRAGWCVSENSGRCEGL